MSHRGHPARDGDKSVNLRNASDRRHKTPLRMRYKFGYLPSKVDNEVAQRSRHVLVGAPNHNQM
jgi:hypothetical protein